MGFVKLNTWKYQNMDEKELCLQVYTIFMQFL
jgi:hypothetical protein